MSKSCAMIYFSSSQARTLHVVLPKNLTRYIEKAFDDHEEPGIPRDSWVLETFLLALEYGFEDDWGNPKQDQIFNLDKRRILWRLIALLICEFETLPEDVTPRALFSALLQALRNVRDHESSFHGL